MKKLTILAILILTSSLCFAQKPMVGFKEKTIRKINEDQFKGIEFYKSYFDEFWVLATEEGGVHSYYYFEYGNETNVLFSHVTESQSTAKIFYTHLSETLVKLDQDLFYDEDTNLYVFVKKQGEKYLFSWSFKRMK